MRSNTKKSEQIRQLLEKILPHTNYIKEFLTLGLEGKQWLASFMICLMLMPLFALPAGASISTAETNAGQFEPVNEQLSVWTVMWRNLNARIESWTTPLRSKNAELGGKDDDKKKKKKTKDIDSEKKVDNNSEEKTAENLNVKSTYKIDSNPENINSLKKASSVKAENRKKTTKIKNKNSAPVTAPIVPLVQQADRPLLDETNLPVLISPRNNLGSPLGQTEAQSAMSPSALSIRERAGIGNYSFGFPVASLPGRGINASVGVSYNSQVWAKSGSQYIYNVDGNWLSPGFQIGYGYLDAYRDGTAAPDTFVLTEPDGTRRQMDHISGTGQTYSYDYLYQSNDGSFTNVEFQRCGDCTIPEQLMDLRVTYSNGTKIYYSTHNSQNRYFPTKVVDVQGNYITIDYLANDEVGKISTITDTLGRVITFNYDSTIDQKLIAVSVPGYNNSTTPRQTIRFYYETLTLSTTNRFDGTITAPATVPVLKYVYMPGDKTGFRYDYSSYYGMIYKITRLNGMAVSTDSTSDMGSVTNTGSYVESASTRYNYAGTDITPPSSTLSDLPKFDKRTDDWIGRTGTAAPETTYSFTEDTTTRTTQTTAPDNTTTVTITNKNPGQWDDGLVKEIFITSPDRTLPWARTIFTWQYGDITRGRKNPRPEKVETVNDAGLSQATTFDYDIYNNQTAIKEHDYAATGQVGTELRRTEITYQTSGTNNPWVARNLINLPVSVKRKVNSTVVSRTDYEYDNYQTQALANTPNVIKHEAAYDPFTSETHQVRGSCKTWYTPPNGGSQVCTEYYINTVSSYDSATNYRGNVTKVTSFVDVANDNDPNASVNETKYDITGNVVQATLNCCNVETIEYSADNKYAYPTKMTKGSVVQLITQAEYDLNTGLVVKQTNENNQDTNYEYESDTLRRKKVTYPNGGYTETEYSDKLVTGSSLVPGFVRTKKTLDSTNIIQSYNYFDARGLGIRSATQTPDGWSVSAVEFDQLRRPVKSYNPVNISTANGAIPGGTKYTEVLGFDALGRTTSIQLQDFTTISTQFSTQGTTPSGFNKTFVTVTDEAGKQRRQIADALGRIFRVDEPDLNGNLGAVDAPNQPTSYEYDGNDNLSKVTQTEGTVTQERRFKYDSLSRLTHEKQVEAIPTLNDSGVKQTSGGSWTKVLQYDSHGLLTYSFDARGVKASFSYDGLNRISSISYTGETGYQTPTISYTYDQARTNYFNKGNLTRIETGEVGDTPATATEFDYDLMGRTVKHRQTIGTQTYSLEYSYNLAGQLTSEKYPSGKIVNVGYDSAGRLSSIADAQRTYMSSPTFNSKTLPSQINYGNGTNQSFGYNDRLQINSQELKKGSEVLQKYEYNYGDLDSNSVLKNNGKLQQVVSYIGTSKQWTQTFKYDSIWRLSETEEKRGDTSAVSYKQKFDFDRFGNLYRKQSANPTTGQENPLTYTPIEDSDISKSTNRFTSNTTYDDAGNVTTDNKFRSMSFGYDANGRMVKASKTNVPDALSVYDAAGMRVAEKVNDIWRFLIYDVGGKLVAEYGGLQSGDEGGVKYLLADWQGSTRAVLSNAGFVQARLDYQTFGEEINAGVGLRTGSQGFSGSNNLRQKYGLTERDEATGLDHTWFRKHENRAGRWTSPDPYNGSMSLGNPQSFNRYSYVENEPTNFVDPNGLQLWAVPQWDCYYILRLDRWERVCEFTGYLIISIGNSPIGGSSSTGGDGGGGGSGASAGPSHHKQSRKCHQDKNGRDRPAIIEQLTKAGLMGFISNIHVNGEGITFDIDNREGFLNALNANGNFRHDTPFGAAHASTVGATIFTVRDFRSFTTGSDTLGPDKVSGLTRSLQIDVGPGTNIPGTQVSSAQGYADLDCDNPAQDVVSFFKHLGKILGL